MNEKDLSEFHIAALWIITLLLTGLGFLHHIQLQKIEKKIEESLDNEPIEIKIEGSWEQFGKLTFNDRVLTKDD